MMENRDSTVFEAGKKMVGGSSDEGSVREGSVEPQYNVPHDGGIHKLPDGMFGTSMSVPVRILGRVVGRQRRQLKTHLQNFEGSKVEIVRNQDIRDNGYNAPFPQWIQTKLCRLNVISPTKDDCERLAQSIGASVAEKARRAPYTHFVSIPFLESNGKNVIESVDAWKNQVLARCTKNRGVEPSLFIHPKQVHISLMMLRIYDEKTLHRVCVALDKLTASIKPIIPKPLVLNFKGTHIFDNDRPARAFIVFTHAGTPTTDEASGNNPMVTPSSVAPSAVSVNPTPAQSGPTAGTNTGGGGTLGATLNPPPDDRTTATPGGTTTAVARRSTVADQLKALGRSTESYETRVKYVVKLLDEHQPPAALTNRLATIQFLESRLEATRQAVNDLVVHYQEANIPVEGMGGRTGGGRGRRGPASREANRRDGAAEDGERGEKSTVTTEGSAAGSVFQIFECLVKLFFAEGILVESDKADRRLRYEDDGSLSKKSISLHLTLMSAKWRSTPLERRRRPQRGDADGFDVTGILDKGYDFGSAKVTEIHLSRRAPLSEVEPFFADKVLKL